tara:strand:+ start:1100 stop:1411 length:312 start_codon:yes stop_codon:yes gene_type:complete
MKLEKVIKSDRKEKKLMAIFCMCEGASCCKDNKKKKVHFGQATAGDYTITKDKEQRERYRTRHKKDLETKDPTRAGYLSRFLLWGDSTSLKQNIKDYKKKFNL